jgi:hypothetical protein
MAHGCTERVPEYYRRFAARKTARNTEAQRANEFHASFVVIVEIRQLERKPNIAFELPMSYDNPMRRLSAASGPWNAARATLPT